ADRVPAVAAVLPAARKTFRGLTPAGVRARPSGRAEVRLLYVLVLLQLLGVVGERDRSCLQYVAPAGDVEGHQGVLLDEEDRRPLRVDLADDLEDPLDEDRREPHRRLVEQQQLRG